MKNLIYGFVCAAICVGFLFMVTTVMGHDTRRKETTANFSSVVDAAIDNVVTAKKYTIKDKEQFANDIYQSLLYTYSNDAKIKIDITDIDVSVGLIVINIKEEYTGANGKSSEQTYKRTFILEQDEEKTKYIVSFINNDSIYKKSETFTGESITIPELPAGKTKWVDETNKEYAAGEKVYINNDKTFTAQ